jgi:putative PIN family toxin of toxin-antitoxin system
VRLVLDTNTALSGLLWDGPPCRLIEAGEAGKVALFSSVALLTELRNVLSRDKFAQPLARRGVDRAAIFSYYLALVTIVAPALITPTILRDPADDAVLAAAVGAGADLVVSGDAHLLNLKTFQGIAIVTAATADGRINPGGEEVPAR